MLAYALYLASFALLVALVSIGWRGFHVYRRFSDHETLLAHRAEALRLQVGRDLAMAGLYLVSTPVLLPALLIMAVSWPFWWVYENFEITRMPLAGRINALGRRIDSWTQARNKPLIDALRQVRGPRRGLAYAEET